MDADHTWAKSSLYDVCILRNGAKAQAILISRLEESDSAEYMFICEQMDTRENWKCTISFGTCFPYPWQHNQNLSPLLVFDGLGKNGLLMRAQWRYFLAWGLGSLRSAGVDIVLIPSFQRFTSCLGSLIRLHIWHTILRSEMVVLHSPTQRAVSEMRYLPLRNFWMYAWHVKIALALKSCLARDIPNMIVHFSILDLKTINKQIVTNGVNWCLCQNALRRQANFVRCFGPLGGWHRCI